MRTSHLPSRIFFVVAFLFLLSNTSFAQFKVDNWKSYTSMQNATCTTLDEQGRYWVGTSGGIFVFEPKDSSYYEIRNNEGLLSMDISTIAFNPFDKKIYAGTYDGYIEIVDMDMQLSHNTDIVSSSLTNPIIKDIYIVDSLAYVAGGFGIAVLDLRNNVFIDAIKIIGNFPQNTMVYQLLINNDTIWAATELGIACAAMDSTLAKPSVWKNYTGNGLAGDPVISMLFAQNKLLLATEKTVFEMRQDSFIVVDNSEEWAKINKLFSFNNRIFFSTEKYIKECNNPYVFFEIPSSINNACNYGDKLALCLNHQGLGIYKDSIEKYLYPNSPAGNYMLSLDVAPDGALWAATSAETGSYGFMTYFNGKWTNFNPSTIKDFNTAYYKARACSDGRVVMSNYGKGFCIVTKQQDTFALDCYNNLNSPITGFSKDTNWVMTGESLLDDKGLLWIVNYGESSNGPVLVSMDKNGNFSSYYNPVNPTTRFFVSLVVDQSGTKWAFSHEKTPSGIFYLNEKQNVSGVITSSSAPLLDNTQYNAAVDNFGFIWMATPSGLLLMTNPSAVLNKKIPSIKTVSLGGLNKQPINDVYVDVLNNKWVATDQGITVINSDGSEILAILTTSNYPLLSNSVYSITSDPSTGTMYFGTKKGISSCRSLSVQPLEKFDIKCYPQPFFPDNGTELVIEGLAENSEIKILTIDGELVNDLASTAGRRNVWNGKDLHGNLVATGTYLIVASSTSSDVTGVGKIAVIRR